GGLVFAAYETAVFANVAGGADVVEQRIAGNVVGRLFPGDVQRGPSDDDGQLGLVRGVRRRCEPDGLARADEGAGRLDEDDGVFGGGPGAARESVAVI